ncbi:flagellar hook-associated protein FlgK [Catenovulum sp. 2E275]|uniref:flagellar hook-associated protein FlgK n=1 Tax=Catenovulum sp. 2E275 TaxID=2980497 RepID=UPI0021CFAA96|nr:flagellar hook-associated protein FlgK [Catenovulum sp. 2E275]MCU4676428.1 flagellar hook-associated protein FlgK [Catenovulum sp. 2E275]
MSSLLQIGSSSLLGNQSQLATTSNNIANLNTPGYSRQRTEFASYVEWGVGRSQVTRLFDQFAIDQYRRDTSEHAKLKALSDNTSILDTLFSNDSTSVAKGIDSVFARLHEAADDPTSLTPRQLVISDSQALVDRMQSLSDRVLEQEKVVNEEIKLQLNETNSLIKSLYDINKAVVTSKKVEVTGQASPELLDERDEIVRQLSEKLNVQPLEDKSGAILLNTQNGQPLVTNGHYFQFKAVNGDPDPTRTEIEIQASNGTSKRSFNTDGLGGELGGLIEYRENVLDETANSLGQLAIAYADAMNEQNKKGVTLDGELGENVFNIPTTTALGYRDNSSANHNIEVGIEAGKGGSVTNFDYQITFTSATEYTIQAFQGGEAVGNVTGPYTNTTLPDGSQSTSPELPDGLTLNLEADGAFVEGDKFLARPTRLAGVQIELNINRPEQLALAAPVTVENPIDNLGSATAKLTDITSTDTSNSPVNMSAFDGAGNLDADAPAKVIYTLTGEYEVQDSSGNVIGTVSSGDNIMQQLRDAGTWPASSHGADYPGYEISVSGKAEAGDEFNIAYNSDSLDDNFNAQKLTDLQSNDTMRRNVTGSEENTLTFNQAYSNLIGFVGDTANRANIDLAASESLLLQSETRVQNMAGVNLDEEAADLIKFEQAYNASARIITVAQTIFDSLLSAVRA